MWWKGFCWLLWGVLFGLLACGDVGLDTPQPVQDLYSTPDDGNTDASDVPDVPALPDVEIDVVDVVDAGAGDSADVEPSVPDLGPPDSTTDETSTPSNWGDVISAIPYQWEWVEFPDTICGDGSPTGLAVNLKPEATRVFIYLEGGGACWDYSGCAGIVQTSLHLGGYDEGTFEGVIAGTYKNMVVFDREEQKNPLRDAHYVFIPYCTGDAFSGNAVVELTGLLPWESKTVHFKGRHNIEVYLDRLAPTFADVEQVVVSGSSAGGLGAGLSWPLFVEAFPNATVDVLDDSGPPIQPLDDRWKDWQDVWNVELPAECIGCDESIDNLMDYYRTQLLGEHRLALMSYDKDAVISTFLGMFPWQFRDKLSDVCDVFDTEDNAQYFVLSGVGHTMMILGYTLIESGDGLPLWRWVEQFVDGESDWSSHSP
ncbi:MAG: hypothetical protein CMH54_06530 [Myxococcales bacterium]|nr:hypothetical protein [Myxococcales bacterium]